MYYHGINAEYLHFHFPIINPKRSEGQRANKQLLDAVHLVTRFGFEPVHLLQCSASYTRNDCIRDCSKFGDSVFVFDELPLPLLYLSSHERGVITLDLRDALYCYVTNMASVSIVHKFLPDLQIRIH